MIDALYDSQPGQTIVIDEPELSLHPFLQKRLLVLFSKYAKDRQIVYATHSPYFVEWSHILNGARMIRVHKKRDRTVVSALGRGTVSAIKGLLANLNNPHILGREASEVFFLNDGVVLVEGPDDVIFYQSIAQQLNCEIAGDFYGWGVGGAPNMPTIAAILKELGFERVVGLLDQGEQNTHTTLAKTFPEYKFFLSPAKDVRTKRERPIQAAVEGLLDSKGELRDQYRNDVTVLFNSMNAALVQSMQTPASGS